MMLSDSTRQMLVQAGWYPGRSVNVDAIVETLISEGLPVFPALLDVFREFAGLTITISDGLSHWPLRFNTAEDIGKTECDAEYVQCIHEQGCIVGFTDSLAAALLVGESGRIYGARYSDPDDMWIIADSIYEAIDCIVNLEPESSYRHLAPYNDDEVREILLNARVIAMVARQTEHPWQLQEALEIDQFLRETGYRVYVIEPASSVVGSMVYANLSQIPEPIDIIVWDGYQIHPNLRDEIIAVHPQSVFSLTNTSKAAEEEVRHYWDAGIRYIHRIGIKNAFERIDMFHSSD